MRENKCCMVLGMTLYLTSCISLSYTDVKHTDTISPYSYGLAKAKTGVERYQVLLKTHQAAVKAGVNVDYSGIKRIEIEIPDNPKQIPLTRYNDFKGCVFVVKNTRKNSRLFNYAKKETPINVSKQSIDAGFFNFIEPLNRGRYLLLIEDENPWVLNRRGHDYGHQRKDVLLVENGRAKNTVTMPYNNAYSKPKCSYIPQDNTPFVFKNVTIERAPSCTFITNVAFISGVDNVQISNVKVHTPANSLINDRGILIYNCTNVSLDNVRIDGTYSQTNHSGYGFTLNNIWNLKMKRLIGKGNWGVFGNNNVNTATMEDSEINRFDIHCYGRNASFKNVKFFDLYNQFSSMYGNVTFENCEFRNFVPVLIETSYNAYTEFDVDINNCVFYTTAKKNYLVNTGSLSGEENARPELKAKKLPKVKVNGLKVISLETGKEQKQVEVFQNKGKFIQERKIQNVIRLK